MPATVTRAARPGGETAFLHPRARGLGVSASPSGLLRLRSMRGREHTGGEAGHHRTMERRILAAGQATALVSGLTMGPSA